MSIEQADAYLKIDCRRVTEMLCRFLRVEIGRAGYEKAVLGLSGGLDSGVAATLCARALGPENVLAVAMPYKTSSEETRRDSRTMIEWLGVRSIDLPIADQVDAYFARAGEASRLRVANKCARERMAVLYDQSAAFGGLVIGTSNKSEILLGYGTQFGDTASAINPIGGLYKTQLRRLAAHLELPESIRSKTPTADLWVGQTDEGELGFSYADADRLMALMVDLRWRREELLRAGFSAELIERVSTLIRRNRYKRRMPRIAKIV
ncbi:MAG: NAD+ synthase [Pirellulales bacterium]|nr:NAD+ synthase [Pirellulales bacterium]